MVRKRVLAAMSGGVDSSVAAALLKKKGFDVIGITMDIWPPRLADARSVQAHDNFGGCCSARAVEDAKGVCDRLGIPHYTLNFRDSFKEAVIDNFISEYLNARTPNPCIRCNEIIKFRELLKKADELGADYLATGHYSTITKGKKLFELRKSKDRKKDQSYFLYPMGQEALKRTLFPVGSLTKTATRQIAKKLGLKVADKKDSQEICFIEDNNYGKFLAESSKEPVKPGPIYDIEGNQVGMHRGISYYTIGQRRGTGLQFGKPFYVIKIDKENNAVIVGEEKDTLGKELIAENVVWTSIKAPSRPVKAKVKIRYASEETDAVVSPSGDNSVSVLFKKPVRSITPGQSVVFYKGDLVLGGGVIKS